jgi:hypothetical protein
MSRLRIPRHLPSAEQIRKELLAMNRPQIEALSKLSGVPFRSLWKVRAGDTENPGIDTVGKFYAHIAAARRAIPAPKKAATGESSPVAA